MLSVGLSKRLPDARSGLLAGTALMAVHLCAIAGRPLTNWNKKGTLGSFLSRIARESDRDAGSTKYLAGKARCGMPLSDSAAAATAHERQRDHGLPSVVRWQIRPVR